MNEGTKGGRRRGVALLAVGLVLGSALSATPAAADFRERIGHIWKHVKAKADERYLRANAPLRPGNTLQGAWAISGNANEFQITAISFPISLPRPPAVHVVDEGDPPPAGCRGTPASPRASRGHLCVFVGERSENVLGDVGTYRPEDGGEGGSRRGLVLYANGGANPGTWEVTGTWAVTAAAP